MSKEKVNITAMQEPETLGTCNPEASRKIVKATDKIIKFTKVKGNKKRKSK